MDPFAPLRLLVISPWSGLIGPAVAHRQLVEEALRRSWRVHLTLVRRDEAAVKLEALGATVHLESSFGLNLRPDNSKTLVNYLRRSVIQLPTARRLVKRIHPHVLCVNAENLWLLPWAGRTTGTPTAVVVHGARFARLGLAGKAYFALQRRSGATYIAVSETVRNALIAMGLPNEQVVTLHNGVDVEACSPGPSDHDFRASLGVASDAPLIVCVSHVTPRKGIHHLVEMMHYVKASHPNIACLVVGGTSVGSEQYRAQLSDRISALGLDAHVRFLDSRPDVPRILREADVVVHPSETESFGLVIAEAMSCGKPVVGFAVDAVPELVDDEITGLLVAPFDIKAAAARITRLLSDSELRHRMGDAGRRKACSEYDERKNVAALLALLERIGRFRHGSRYA